MKIMFLGAAHEVTGSSTFIEFGGAYGLVDYGMEQGKDLFENRELPVSPSQLDFVLLTHAHIDHSGRLPVLTKNGYKGPIYATEPTCSLCSIMLKDSAHIQESEAEWQSRKAERAGRPPVEPMYTLADAEAAIKRLRPCPYDEIIQISENMAIRFTDIGHLLGSACIEVWFTENGVTKKIVFSGDIGNKNQPIIRDPHLVEEADFVVTECTYGDRYHAQDEPYIDYLAECIQRTLDRGGNVVIPAFAVGRTQEMLYFIREIKEKGLVKGHPGFPVYVDSPLALEATGIFLQTDTRYFDDDTRALLERGVNPLVFDGLRMAVSSEESKAINFNNEPKVIISASGMCDAGRIRHHLKHNLWRPESLILFVGFQAVGTLGRAIRDGAEKVKLFGEEITIKAELDGLPGKSGHADKGGLLEWIGGFKKKRPEMVFVVHGEPQVCEEFVQTLDSELGLKAFAPYSGTVFDLSAGRFVDVAEAVPVVKESPARERANAAFRRLTAAGERLLRLIGGSSGLSNKDLARFTDQIDALAAKWEK